MRASRTGGTELLIFSNLPYMEMTFICRI
jgi:hypothetical protein